MHTGCPVSSGGSYDLTRTCLNAALRAGIGCSEAKLGGLQGDVTLMCTASPGICNVAIGERPRSRCYVSFWSLNRSIRFGLEREGLAREGGVLYQDHRDRIRYPRSLLSRESRPWRKRPPRRSVALADQLDAYLGLTAPLRHRQTEAGTAVQGTLWEDGPIPIRRDHLEGQNPHRRQAVPRQSLVGRGSLSR